MFFVFAAINKEVARLFTMPSVWDKCVAVINQETKYFSHKPLSPGPETVETYQNNEAEEKTA